MLKLVIVGNHVFDGITRKREHAWRLAISPEEITDPT